jgi:hypothetical protein
MKLTVLAAALVVSVLPLYAQVPTTVLFPSAYYTAGSYSSGTRSDSYSGYASISFHGFDYLVAGYDKMLMESSTWTYDQHLFVVGGQKNLYPFYLKLNYGGLKGTFSLPSARYSYDDHIDILNGGLLYNVDLFFVGPTYTYVNVRGYKTLQCHQVGLQGEWVIDPAFSVSLTPLYTTLTDGRSLVSATAGMTYSPVQPLVLQVSGVLGKRAYYFNPDLLTIFNQDETQESLWSVRAEYTIGGVATLIGSYQSTGFTGYTVKYLALGVRARFDL